MKILLAVDDTPYSLEAVKALLARPWPIDTTVRVLSIIENMTPPATEIWYDAGTSLRLAEQAQQEKIEKRTNLLADIAERLKVGKFVVETVIRQGDPRTEIVDEAKNWLADLIMVGSHGYTGIKRWLLGSVAQSVVSHAPCSVEVVRLRHADSLKAAG
ncbi:MAG: universal stress protein [Acidobacteriota bacterium]